MTTNEHDFGGWVYEDVGPPAKWCRRCNLPDRPDTPANCAVSKTDPLALLLAAEEFLIIPDKPTMDGKAIGEAASQIVKAIWADVTDRRGIKREFNGCDPDVQEGIRRSWSADIVKILKTTFAESEMRVVIEKFNESGRPVEVMSFNGENMMGKGRENFNAMLRENPGEPVRLIVVHGDHNGTSESAAKLLR